MLKPPPSRVLGCTLEESIANNLSQEDYLKNLEKRHNRIESSRNTCDTTMRFRKGTANELQKISRATMEYEYQAKRETLLNSPLVDDTSIQHEIHESDEHDNDSLFLLAEMHENNDNFDQDSGEGKYSQYDKSSKYYENSSDEEEGDDDLEFQENGDGDTRHEALVERTKEAKGCCEQCLIQ